MRSEFKLSLGPITAPPLTQNVALGKSFPVSLSFFTHQMEQRSPPSTPPGGVGRLPSSHACEGLCQPPRTASLLSVTWIPLDLRPAGERVSPCLHMPLAEAILQDQNRRQGMGVEGGGRTPKALLLLPELGTEGLEFAVHIFVDFSALCQLRAFTSQKFI